MCNVFDGPEVMPRKFVCPLSKLPDFVGWNEAKRFLCLAAEGGLIRGLTCVEVWNNCLYYS